MTSQYVSLPEIIWTIAGIPGVLAWVFNLYNVYRAYSAARAIGDRVTRLIAGSLFRLGIFGSLASLGIIALGLFGMTQPQVVTKVTPTGWAVTAVLVLLGLLTTAAGIDINRTITLLFSDNGETEPRSKPDGREQQ